MSDDGTMASDPSMSSGVRGTESKLYDASGEPLRTGLRSAEKQTDQLIDFVQAQPLTAALVALVVGYLLGKVT